MYSIVGSEILITYDDLLKKISFH